MKHVLLVLFFFIAIFHVNSQPDILKKIPQGPKVKLVIFISIDCPISQKYIPLLKNIKARYSQQGLNIYAVIPGKTKKNVLKSFIQEYDIDFTVFTDIKYNWVKALHPKATPEVFVFDNTNALKYHGGIDNWFYELGRYRKEPTENYLIDAVESLLADREIKIANTQAIGCSIHIPL